MAIDGAGYRAQLAEALREIRVATGLSGNMFAQRLAEANPELIKPGRAQSFVSKIETGKQVPSRPQLVAWVETAGRGNLDWLQERAERARYEQKTFKDAFDAGQGRQMQLDIRTLEKLCRVHLKFQPMILPSQVRTARYAHEMLSKIDGAPGSRGATPAEIDTFVADQMDRKDVLRDPDKKVRVVVLEAALRYPLASPTTMRLQLSSLLDLSDWPSLEFGIIPLGTLLPVMPMTGFGVWDDTLVTIETMTGLGELRNQDDIEAYDRYFQELAGVAVYGDAQWPLIQTAIDALPRS